MIQQDIETLERKREGLEERLIGTCSSYSGDLWRMDDEITGEWVVCSCGAMFKA
jgi:hypothetical protein